MVFLYIVFTVSLGALLIGGMREQRRHYRNLNSIPVRVMVNGIRGKSSITRLCAGALRGGEMRVVAKTTGTAARFIYPDASEMPVYRKFNIANVAEQIGIVAQAAAERPDAFVIECMAVMPPLQEINQEKLIRSNIGVLCNVREDHLAEMGPTLEDVARSLSRSMPHGDVCITAESEWFEVLQDEADKRDCRLIYADPESVSDEEMDGFSFFTFKENVAIALAVAAEVGVSRQDALAGMYAAPPDPGVLSVETYDIGGKRLALANIFAANDPNSTVMNFKRLLEADAIKPPIFTLINCRPDRVERNGQMGEIVPDLLTDKLFVIGQPSRSAITTVPKTWDGEVIDLGGDGRDPQDIFGTILEHAPQSGASLVAIGNIHGQGERLLEHLEEFGELR
ncbi:MAG: poly-gamma-glutamate synthase PgsB [Actinomycetota bacterium]|nr:poly-gamma-glutamate synthase PgsB [Actinomycetota bacterium]